MVCGTWNILHRWRHTCSAREEEEQHHIMWTGVAPTNQRLSGEAHADGILAVTVSDENTESTDVPSTALRWPLRPWRFVPRSHSAKRTDERRAALAARAPPPITPRSHTCPSRRHGPSALMRRAQHVWLTRCASAIRPRLHAMGPTLVVQSRCRRRRSRQSIRG